ncbi:MAG: hypothetical protein IJZ02_06795 [Clostridia bacterium]|nr:hypothetical protein [Clostridia bacterium]
MDAIRKKEYRRERLILPESEDLCAQTDGMTQQQKWVHRFVYMLDNEKPIIHEDDLFGFNRYRSSIARNSTLKPSGFSNITPDYVRFLAEGLNGLRRRVTEQLPGRLRSG